MAAKPSADASGRVLPYVGIEGREAAEAKRLLLLAGRSGSAGDGRVAGVAAVERLEPRGDVVEPVGLGIGVVPVGARPLAGDGERLGPERNDRAEVVASLSVAGDVGVLERRRGVGERADGLALVDTGQVDHG